jgi:hypothetical protein
VTRAMQAAQHLFHGRAGRIGMPRVAELARVVEAAPREGGRRVDGRDQRPGRVGVVDAGVDSPGLEGVLVADAASVWARRLRGTLNYEGDPGNPARW